MKDFETALHNCKTKPSYITEARIEIDGFENKEAKVIYEAFKNSQERNKV